MWQHFLQERPERRTLAFLSVAVDVDPERARPYASDKPFPTVVDSAGQLGRLFDFDVVPNGLFVDEQGIVRFIHIGGFDIRRPEVSPQMDALLESDYSSGAHASAALTLRQEPLDVELLRVELAGDPLNAGLHFALGETLLREGRLAEAETSLARAAELDPSDWSARFGLGTALYQQGHTTDALASWRAALVLDPPNFTVRKQIWMVEHPEKFYPTIDFDWQKGQLEREGFVP
ncbi:MAG: tetratricopeptide repeat protein [Chloroflexota bacterium]|nr:tetratricopeptide repeat protein [Chloroflexota bacterium]